MGEKREHYPEPTAAPCSECPWRKEAVPGHLGPHTPHDWIRIAHGEAPIACHKTVVVTDPLEGTGDWEHPKIRQCRGAAIFRTHVGKKPKHPEIATCDSDDSVFGTNEEFVAHHGGEPMTASDMFGPLSTEKFGHDPTD